MSKFIEVTNNSNGEKTLLNINNIQKIISAGDEAVIETEDNRYEVANSYEEVKEIISNDTNATDRTLKAIADILLGGEMKIKAQIYQ